MTEQTFRTAPLTGDAVSQLIQLVARDVGLKSFKPTGRGDTDVRQLVTRAYNVELGNQELWVCVGDILKLVDATPEISEVFKATLSAGVLRARACVDLGQKQ